MDEPKKPVAAAGSKLVLLYISLVSRGRYRAIDVSTAPRQARTAPRRVRTAPRQIRTAPHQIRTAPSQIPHQIRTSTVVPHQRDLVEIAILCSLAR